MKPILFNTEMVRAIQNGTKTATRRVVKPQPVIIQNKKIELQDGIDYLWLWNEGAKEEYIKSPYRPGDILYVRETFWKYPSGYEYKADYNENPGYIWSPSIHMPREAARIFLRVTDVRVERLQDITDDDAVAEGFASRADFIAVFLKMYPECTEESWVWVIEFERISREEAYK